MCVSNLQETPRAVSVDEEATHTHPLNLFILKKHPRLLQIPEQMTYDECELLKASYGVKAIQEALIHLENKPLEKYQRVFNTLKIFCDNVRKNGNLQQIQAAASPVMPTKPAPRAISCEEAAAIQEAKRKKQLEEQDGGEKIDISELIAKTFSKNGKMHAAERS